MTVGVAGNMAVNGMVQFGQGKRPSMRDLLLTPGNVRRVSDQLALMRGAAMKIGQLVSMDTGDVLPPELAQIMARLRSDAHFMPPAQLKKVLNANWPAGWLGRFERFDVHPIAAASIGQVHRARTRDGQELAIKVQYPGVAKSIDSDVANVAALLRMSGLLPRGFDLAPYIEEARQQLHDETDYVLEGQNLAHFGALLQDDPRFAVPTLSAEWTTPEVLAMSFVEGTAIEDIEGLSQGERDRIGLHLIDLMLSELLTFGVMQTDPNFANYRYDARKGRIVLLDFGATRRINGTISKLYRGLIVAGLAQDHGALEKIAEDIGFVGPDMRAEHRARILGMIEMVFAALKATPNFDFGATNLPLKMQAEGQALAEDGFVPPPLPIDTLFLQRKFGGIFLLASKLGARVAVVDLLETRLSQR